MPKASRIKGTLCPLPHVSGKRRTSLFSEAELRICGVEISPDRPHSFSLDRSENILTVGLNNKSHLARASINYFSKVGSLPCAVSI